MAFTITGRRLGRRVEVRWAETPDGVTLDGDDAVLAAVADLVRRGATVGLEPVGPFHRAGVGEGWRALLTLRAALDMLPAPEVEGDLDGLEPPGGELDPDTVA